MLVLAMIAYFAASIKGEGAFSEKKGDDYIGKIEISGVISEDDYRDKVLTKLQKDEHLKALIVSVNSPGGTTVGGEDIYYQLKDILAAGKPVVVVMKTLATSAGYLVALGGEHIIARNGTITGSIGVLVQAAEFTDLAEKLGVKFETFKSSPLKAAPSPFEKTTPEVAAVTNAAVLDFYDFFVQIVAKERKFDIEKAKSLADGRIYTGSQALKLGLIDEIGGQKEAIEWLKNKGLDARLDVQDISVEEPQNPLHQLIFGDIQKTQILGRFGLNGLLAIWQN